MTPDETTLKNAMRSAFPFGGNPPLARLMTDPKTGLVYVWRDGAWTAVARVA